MAHISPNIQHSEDSAFEEPVTPDRALPLDGDGSEGGPIVDVRRIRSRLKLFAGPLDFVPLVDVVFLLLIFFMISSSLVFWPGTKVDTRLELPVSRTTSMTAADKIIITVTAQGLVFINDMPVQWEDVERRLREILHQWLVRYKTGPNKPGFDRELAALRRPVVVFRADRRLSYGKIVELMTLCRSLDLDVYLATKPGKKSPSGAAGAGPAGGTQ